MSNEAAAPAWWIYILDCDGRLYTGITTDPDRRLREHRACRVAKN
ncbi:MAG: GIY-YIG nuclease family protein [Gammaproteobacteria bacterium]|nr:GIY-YIG nuclease family protein [Gammaproteobacteria bacterium]